MDDNLSETCIRIIFSSNVVLLSDLGEGKDIHATLETKGFSSTISQDYGLTDYRAPEIPKQGYSVASDVFAWAWIAVHVIRINHSKLSDAADEVRFPSKLMQILEHFLSHNPKDRLLLDVISVALGEIVKQA